MTDTLANAVRAAWLVHSAAISSGSDLAVRLAFVAVLEAERALETDCLASCTQPATCAAYRLTIADYDARIQDERAALALAVRKAL